MTIDTKIAILDSTQPAVAAAVAALPAGEQDAILSSGGNVTLASGKSPNGMNCTIVARVTNNLTAQVFAVSDDGREQPIAARNVVKFVAMLAK